MVDLSILAGGLLLSNPVMPASGTFGEGLEQVFDINCLGAIVTKTITREVRTGNPTPRIAETRQGLLNSIGIPSKGIQYFLENTVPHYRQFSSPLVVSISAPTAAQFASLARDVSVSGVKAIEANISCPNLEEEGRAFAMKASSTEDVVRSLRQATDLPLWVKLTPNTGEIADVGKAAEYAGADAIVVANTILGMAIDTETFRPRLANVMGGLSGPAIKPIIVRMVYQCSRAVNIPVIGCGGISNLEDTVEYLLAGAVAVQVGTASMVSPMTMPTIINGLIEFCERKEIDRIADLVGGLVINMSDTDDENKAVLPY